MILIANAAKFSVQTNWVTGFYRAKKYKDLGERCRFIKKEVDYCLLNQESILVEFRISKAALTRKLVLANLCWQTCVGKLKLICVKGTKTVGKQVGKMLATSRTCLYSRQLFCVGKLKSAMWKLGQHVLVIINQSKRALLTWFICVRHHKMGDASQHFLNLSKLFTTVRLFRTFHL